MQKELTKQQVLKVHPSDNVIVALTDLKKGDLVVYENESYVIVENIPQKHKFATTDLAPGDSVIMYGVLVGKMMKPVLKGGLISTQNLKHAASAYYGKNKEYTWTAPEVSKWKNRTFMGYHRSDGRVGTANYWLFIPTVFCENRNLEFIKDALNKELGYGKTEKYKESTKKILGHTLITILKLLHPFMPFITEELWGKMREAGLLKNDALLMVNEWPK